ncbi:MAG: 2-phosphosulfolactate phosphatase [Limisphaerales bacterium]
MKIEVILTPSELPALAKRDLRETVCVVFDVLRATSTFVTALRNGAKAIIPVSKISEALAIKKKQPEVLLGGERHGVKIRADGIDFDLGNSPREYAREKVAGKTIVSTTTNGTRALRAGVGAKMILAASFLNLSATAKFLQKESAANILLVCAGTRENAALEDILAAGALVGLLGEQNELSDSARLALHAYANAKSNLNDAIFDSENARRVRSIPELFGDVEFCLQRDIFNFIAALGNDGVLRRI